MAKQLVNPIERHFEKGVVGLAALVLLYFVASYLIVSPTQMDLGGTTVTPNSIDAHVDQAASRIRERFREASAEEDVPGALYDEFMGQLDPYRAAELPLSLPAVVTLGPQVPLVDPPEVGAGGTTLAAVVPFTQVAATAGRTTFKISTPQGLRHIPTNWVTVSGLFDVKAQIKEFVVKYGVLNKKVWFGMPELQRRAQRLDGTWSDEDWEFVEPWRPLDSGRLPGVPTLRLAEERGAIILDHADRGSLDQFLDDLQLPKFQLDLIRPMLPDRANGDTWGFPNFTSRRELLLQDDHYLFPDQPPAQEPTDRYRSSDAGTPAARKRLSKAQQIQKAFEDYDRLVASAKKNKIKNDATKAYNLMFDIMEDPEAKASDKSRAKKLKDQAAVLETTIRRQLLFGGRPSEKVADVEGKQVREQLSAQQLWVHDGAEGSIESGWTYQYRLRTVLYNTLAGRPQKFLDHNDATAIWLVGPWSTPVEVSIEAHTRFFVTGDDRRRQAVTVEFYRWFEGVWIKSRRVKLGVGAQMRDEQQRVVPDPLDQTIPSRALVEFSSGASVLDVDFQRRRRERRRGTSRTGVRFGDQKAETAVVLVDAGGRLIERFVTTDKANDERKMLDGRLWKAP